MRKKTKIVATISDLRCEPEFIKSLYEAGMNVVRLNTAHQSFEQTLKIIENVRKVSDKIGILVDTKGPEIRTTASEYKVAVRKGDLIKIRGDACQPSTPDCVYVNHNDFVKELKTSDKILIDDGDIEFIVRKKEEDYLLCEATNDGLIKSRKSVNVPGISFTLPALSNKDREYIKFAIKHGIDFIAHSFVRNKSDVLEIRKILEAEGSNIKIIAKIENQEGVDNIDEIIENVYGVMVARGDLAIEIPYEKIPAIQKIIVTKCINARKPVIIATQMLHSMIENPRPTRAEVTDVANAIYSKTDAIMLSGETAYGNYPLESVQTMSKIAIEIEKSRKDIHKTPLVIASTETSAFLTKAAVEASIKLDCAAIIADTTTGRTIRNMAGFRGKKIIYAQCYNKNVVRELSLSYGIYPHFLSPTALHDFIKIALEGLVISNCLSITDRIVAIGGNFGTVHGASFIEISTVENLIK